MLFNVLISLNMIPTVYTGPLTCYISIGLILHATELFLYNRQLRTILNARFTGEAFCKSLSGMSTVLPLMWSRQKLSVVDAPPSR